MSPEVAYLDSHLHLTDDRLADELEEVLQAAADAGVGEVVTVGTAPEDAVAAAEIAAARPGVWATAGLHPHRASRWSEEVAAALRDVAGRPRVVAVGETGLDFHYENSPRAEQLESFEAQVRLAEAVRLPVVVHSRDADAETAAVIRDAGADVTGVLHCFTGGRELMQTALEAGWYVSFSGIVTFGGFDASLVREVPDDRLLIETDSPYLAPEPKRGRRNEPAFLPFTCERVARLREQEPSQVAQLTRRNARAFYRLDGR